jgi:GNAT superfamily N-acetyltransferase
MINVRLAEESEIDWINSCYDKADLARSKFDKEIIAIAEVDKEKAGLGRLLKVDSDNLELGGIYVMEAFRSLGIAKELVKFLVEQVKPYQTLYCIPFKNLIPFYEQFGFVPCKQMEKVPADISKKWAWCQSRYTQPTTLMVIEKKE